MVSIIELDMPSSGIIRAVVGICVSKNELLELFCLFFFIGSWLLGPAKSPAPFLFDVRVVHLTADVRAI